MRRSYTRKIIEFPPCTQGNREGGKNSYIFYYIYKMKFFRRLNSSVSRATVHGLKGPRFESRPQTNIFFHYFYYSLLENASLICKNGQRPVLYGNVINLIIYALKVLISNILLKKYYSKMRCGLDKKK